VQAIRESLADLICSRCSRKYCDHWGADHFFEYVPWRPLRSVSRRDGCRTATNRGRRGVGSESDPANRLLLQMWMNSSCGIDLGISAAVNLECEEVLLRWVRSLSKREKRLSAAPVRAVSQPRESEGRSCHKLAGPSVGAIGLYGQRSSAGWRDCSNLGARLAVKLRLH
jgi:hypothetical protein